MEKIYIGNVGIEKTAALAPMASVADRAYRLICKQFGAAYCVSEMISSKGLCFGDKKTAELCTITDEERPCALQIFGEDAYYVSKAAYLLNAYSPDVIDINMGCPVPKIVKSGSGSALMSLPKTAEEIVRQTVKNSCCPVTVKIRAGRDAQSINAVDFAKRMEQAGAAAVTVHGRTAKQMYSGKADRQIIADVKKAVKIPVIGNGDVDSAEDCVQMYKKTDCDLVMVGRATYGNPWIFEQIDMYIRTGTLPPPKTIRQRMEIMLRHAQLMIENKGEEQAMKEMRHNVIWYVKGIRGAAALRRECSEIKEYSQLEKMAAGVIAADTEN